MTYISQVRRSLLRGLVLAVVALSVLAPGTLASSNSNPSNTVTITIAGGDANALAVCLNAAKEHGNGNVDQRNKCKNKAYAAGGNVVLKNVEIIVAQATVDPYHGSGGSNTVNLTILGGDANALAACVNLAREEGSGDVNQRNKCNNTAIAVGGSVTLKNVTILIVQENS